MKKIIVKIFIISILVISLFSVDAFTKVTPKTIFRIEKLWPSEITIGQNRLKTGDTFLAGEKIEWVDYRQSMLVKDLSSSATMRLSKSTFENKGSIKSIHDLFFQINRGSTAWNNKKNSIKLEESRIMADLIIKNPYYKSITDSVYKINKNKITHKYPVEVQTVGGNFCFYPLTSDKKDNDSVYFTPTFRNAKILEKEGKYDAAKFTYLKEKKNPWCQNNIGIIESIPPDYILDVYKSDYYKKAFEWYKKAAKHGVEEAMINIAVLFWQGHGVQKDYNEAMKWLKKAADKGNSDALYAIGLLHTDPEYRIDYDTYREWNNKAIDAGNEYAMYCFGIDFLEGIRGANQDFDKAKKWFLMASEKNHPESQYQLGMLYYNGILGEKNYDEAKKWFLKASENDHPGAQYQLGMLYYNGIPGEKNYDEAKKWFLRASENDYSEAQYQLGVLYYNDEAFREENYGEAVKWFERGAKDDHIGCQYMLGCMYYYDRLRGKEYRDEAMRWFECGALEGHTGCQYMLGLLYYEESNIGRAKEWMEKAAASGHEDAKEFLAEQF
ncbi:MAG: sel1 repeat family protein [Bacteroides sp.]|nr:sel1 repeat family protein [Bacteroides sp.]